MSRVAVMGVIIGIMFSAGACLYLLHTTHSLASQLGNLDKKNVQVIAGLSPKMRESMDRGFKEKYSEQLASFARLARELQIEKDKGANFTDKAPNSLKNH